MITLNGVGSPIHCGQRHSLSLGLLDCGSVKRDLSISMHSFSLLLTLRVTSCFKVLTPQLLHNGGCHRELRANVNPFSLKLIFASVFCPSNRKGSQDTLHGHMTRCHTCACSVEESTPSTCPYTLPVATHPPQLMKRKRRAMANHPARRLQSLQVSPWASEREVNLEQVLPSAPSPFWGPCARTAPPPKELYR